MIDYDYLARVQLLKGLSQEQIRFVGMFLEEVRYQRGDRIIEEESVGYDLFILYKGSVRVTKKLTLTIEGLEAEEKTLITLSEKENPVFGESGLVESGKRTANVIALSDCVMYRLTRDRFRDMTHQDIHTAFLIMQNTAARLAALLLSTDENVVKFATALSIAVNLQR